MENNKNKFKNRIKFIYIYCYWLWLWALLYYNDFISISPLLSLIPAVIFTTYITFCSKIHKDTTIFLKILIVTIEITVLNKIFNKSQIITNYDIIANILLFLVYSIYIKSNNLTFYKIYFQIIPKSSKNKGFFEYLKLLFKNFIK